MRALPPVLCLALILTGAPASAFGFWEGVFGMRGHGDDAPDWRTPAPRREWARRPAPRRHVEIRVGRPNPTRAAPGEPKMADYLASARFTSQMASGDASASSVAVAYLLRHDSTLRPGDALVTRKGVVVFEDEGAPEFVPLADSGLRGAVKTRLLAVQPTRASPAAQAPAIALSPEPFGLQRTGFSPVDSGAIRLEGAPMGDAPKPFAIRPR